MGCSHSIIGGSSCIEAEDVNNGRRRRDGEAAASTVSGDSPPPSPEVVDVKASCRKMAWSLGLMLSRAGAIRQRRKRGGMGNECRSSENNKSWLLADARAETEAEAEPQSVHSSFRFSFGSQAEAVSELSGAASVAAGTTVLLLVNLEDEGEESRRGEGVGEWRRLESVERSISPLAGALVRYSYAEIRSVTRGFSRGTNLLLSFYLIVC